MALPAWFDQSDEDAFWGLLAQADQAGVRLEMVGGTPVWEAFPGIKHHNVVRRLVKSIDRNQDLHEGCGCFPYTDIYVKFSDGSYKRPDLSLFCSDIEEVDGATDRIPEAVVEVLSRGYEAKDLDIGVPFYLKNGVREVLIMDPRAATAHLYTCDGVKKLPYSGRVKLDCGCVIDL